MNNQICGIWLSFVLLISGFPATEACGQTQVPTVFNIRDYGARPDKSGNAQAAIQRAIEACAAAGGGQVLVPAGTYGTATVYLRSNVELHLASGATLLALSDSTLYRNDKAGLLDAGDSFIPALIVAKNVTNVGLTGPGRLLGEPRFTTFPVTAPDAYPGWTANALAAGLDMKALRVRNPKVSLVYISGCRNVALRDVHIENSPNWSCHLQWSQDVTIRGVHISSSLERGVNSDGLDIDGCKRVLVSDCIIRTGDDAICLKTTRQGGRSETCEDISVSNCTLSSSSCALKIGTETNADFRRILFTNCTISETNRALGIIVRDGAVVSDVVFSNIVLDCRRRPFFWWGNGEAFHFTVLKRNVGSKVGRIENVRIQGVSGGVEGTSTAAGFTGVGEDAYASIRNITLADIHLALHAESERDKRATDGIAISNAEGIDLRAVALDWDAQAPEPKWAHGLALRTVRNFRIAQFENRSVPQNREAAVLLTDAQHGSLNCSAPTPVGQVYCQVTGSQTRDLRIQAPKLIKPAQLTVEPAARKAVLITYCPQ